jgi:site-specific recombinase XerD
VETGDQIFFDIPATNTKTKRSIEVPLAPEMIACLKLYLTEFRPHIPGADEHNGLFASNKGQPMDDGSIYDAVRRRTKAGLGVSINLHRFRSMAGRLWSIHAPASIRGVKDVLGHAGFSTTDQNYIPSQSRDAGRALRAAMQNRLNGKKGQPGYES